MELAIVTVCIVVYLLLALALSDSEPLGERE